MSSNLLFIYLIGLIALTGCSPMAKQIKVAQTMSPPLPKRMSLASFNRLPHGTNQPPPIRHTITYAWLNDNMGDTNVITGLQSTSDFVTWQTLCVTNCDSATNYFTVSNYLPCQFFRAYCDLKP